MSPETERPGLVPGLKGSLDHTVRREDCADTWGSGGVAVLSTPHMIGLMERAAQVMAQEHLRPGETTVGTRVDVEHLEACPPGTQVRFEAELRSVGGRRLNFTVTASASAPGGEVLLGRGTHERFILNAERFLARLAEKWGESRL